MKRADAPRPGWYPDPTGAERLRWWDGLDWTEDRRVAPRAGRLAMEEELAAAAEARGQAASARSGSRATGRGAAPRIRTGGRAAATAGVAKDDVGAIVREVRAATREEVQKATGALTDSASSARSQLEPLISEYGTKLVGLVRRLVVIGVVLWVLYLAVSGAVQTGLMGWLGDRVDNAVNGMPPVSTVLTPDDSPPVSHPV